MVVELPKRKIIFIDDDAPSGDPSYYGWFDTTTRTVKVWENGQWVVKLTFTELLEGYTGTVKVGGEDFTFENGLLKTVE